MSETKTYVFPESGNNGGGGKLMQCIEELSEGEGMGERWDDDDRYYDDESMGERGGYSGSGRGMGQRRGVRGTGRYSRYR